MIKQQIIVLDVGGYTERLRALSDSSPHVVGVTPHDLPCAGFAAVRVPEEWLPSDTTIPYAKRCWHATGTLGLAAIEQLGLDADHYWFIESDCVASPARWKSLIDSHAENQTDGVFVCARTRAETLWNPWWNHPGTPPWADVTHINAIYRLSRKAVGIYLAVIQQNRECFGEMLIGSAIKRAGATLGRINNDLSAPHLNNQTIKADPARVIINPRLINHPVKSNTYGV